ncbi:hypothetical protein KY334_05230 [Candidatus Woesearchaeota archaeon]|nr:hypothetical protein [Candidatus Woesearchaeota archaeon]
MKHLFLKELLIASIFAIVSYVHSNYKDEIVAFFKDEVIVEEEKDDSIYNEFDDPLF